METQTEMITQMPTYTFTVGKTNDKWLEQYGLQEQFLQHEGRKTPYKAIVRKGELMAIVSRRYSLLPNEEMVKAADEVATMVGAVPLHEFSGSWLGGNSSNWVADEHVFKTGRRSAQAHALYAIDEPVEVGPGDKVQFGFAVHNSIDSSMGFCISAFTFRYACKNMVFVGFKGKNIRAGVGDNQLKTLYRRHVGKMLLNKSSIQQNMLNVIEQGKRILERYRKMQFETLQREQAQELLESLPKKYLPEYIKADKDKKLVDFEEHLNLWGVYNDITEAIWHQSEAQFSTKKNRFDALHKVLEVQ